MLATRVPEVLGRPDWLFVERKGPSVAFHVRQADDRVAARAAVEAAIAEVDRDLPPHELAHYRGRLVVDLRPRSAGGKREAVEALLAELRAGRGGRVRRRPQRRGRVRGPPRARAGPGRWRQHWRSPSPARTACRTRSAPRPMSCSRHRTMRRARCPPSPAPSNARPDRLTRAEPRLTVDDQESKDSRAPHPAWAVDRQATSRCVGRESGAFGPRLSTPSRQVARPLAPRSSRSAAGRSRPRPRRRPRPR